MQSKKRERTVIPVVLSDALNSRAIKGCLTVSEGHASIIGRNEFIRCCMRYVLDNFSQDELYPALAKYINTKKHNPDLWEEQEIENVDSK